MAAESSNNPGQLDINLQLVGRPEVESLVSAITTMTENVKAAQSMASEVRLQAEQSQLRGHQQEHPSYRPPSVTPVQEQQRLSSNQVAAASSGKDTVSEAGEAPPSGLPSERASVPSDAPTEELPPPRVGLLRRASQKALRALEPNEFSAALADRQTQNMSAADQELRDIEGPASTVSHGASRGGGGGFGGGGGGGGGFGGGPGDISPDDPQWKRSLIAQTIPPSMSIPRLGEMTAQDQLMMFSTAFSRFAGARQARAEKNLGEAPSPADLAGLRDAGGIAGETAAWFGHAARVAPYAHQISRNLGMTDAPGIAGLRFNPSELIEEQAQRGYSTAGGSVRDIPLIGKPITDLTGFDINLPASVRMLVTEAGREGMRREAERTRERGRNPGLTSRDQLALEEQLTATGMARDREGRGQPTPYQRDLRRGMMRVLGGDEAQESGLAHIDPAGAFDSLLRATQHGGTSVEDFVDTMQNIPDAANAARLSMEEVREQMVAMGEQFSEMGGANATGQQFAQDWAIATGMPPATAQKLLSNPMVTGVIAQQNNVMPQQVGILPSDQISSGMFSAMRQIEQTYRHVRPQLKPRTIGGDVIEPTRREVREGREALMAQQAGLTPDEWRHTWRNLQNAERYQGVAAASRVYARSERQAKGRGLEDVVAGRGVRGDQLISAGEMRNELREAGFNAKEISRAMSGKTAAQDAKNIRRMVSQKTAKMDEKKTKETTRVVLDLTPDAAKLVREASRDKRVENAEMARSGKGMAAEIFARNGAPANKRERRRIEQWAKKHAADNDDNQTGLFHGRYDDVPDYLTRDEAEGGGVGETIEDAAESVGNFLTRGSNPFR